MEREGRPAAGWSPHFCSDLKFLEDKSLCVCQALLPAPPLPPPPTPHSRQAQREQWHPFAKQPAFAKQPGALGLRLSALSGCYGSCSRKPSLPTIKAFLPEPGSRHLAFQQGRQRGRGRWEPSHHTPAAVSARPDSHLSLALTPGALPCPEEIRLFDSLSPSPLPSALDPKVPGLLHGRGGKVSYPEALVVLLLRWAVS